jgi:hypothetical protein
VIEQRIDVADVLRSTAEDGDIRVTLGDYITGKGISVDSSMWGMDGFYSRPNNPTDDGATLAFYVEDANEKWILGTKDNRFREKVGLLKEGDRAIISDCNARIFLKKEQDAIVLYTENASEDLSMMINLAGIEGLLRLMNGNSFIMLENDKISMGVNGGGGIMIDDQGVHITGKIFNCNTLGGHLGIIPGPNVAPPVGVNSILAGAVGPAGVGSLNWTVSP